MDISVNWLAVVLAGLSTLVVGSAWYSPKTFGKEWEKLIRQDEDKKGKKKSKQSPLRAILIALVVSLVTAYVLAHMAFLAHHYFHRSFLFDTLATAFWLWLGLTAARYVMHDTFEGRRQRLTLITIGHELVVYMVMGLIIGLLKP